LNDGQCISLLMSPSLLRVEPNPLTYNEGQAIILARLKHLEKRRDQLLSRASHEWYEMSQFNELSATDRGIQECLRHLDSEIDC
jgi:hypothetical protein